MISLQTQVVVPGLSGKEVTDFLSVPNDADYQRWWPGVHLHLHTIEGIPGEVGSVLYMDEFIGNRRYRFKGRITGLIPGKRLAWRLKSTILPPALLELDLDQEGDALRITHAIHIGWPGLGRLFDPFIRMWTKAGFADAMDEHVRTEFPLLRDLLRGHPPHAGSS